MDAVRYEKYSDASVCILDVYMSLLPSLRKGRLRGTAPSTRGRATRRRAREMWLNTGKEAPTMEEGKIILSKFNDNNLNLECLWKAIPGGDRDRRKFACCAHVQCGVQVRLLGKDGKCVLQILAGVEHEAELSSTDRANASLTREQKRELKAAMRYGGTAGDVMKDAQAAALKQGARLSSSGVGVDGACVRSLPVCCPCVCCPCVVVCDRDAPCLHMNARRCVRSACIRAHSHASARIRAHRRTFLRIHTH